MTRTVERALDRAIAPTKQAAKRHYGSHPYFTKRAWNVVQSYIAHFSSPGDLVLDPFGGSGVTAVESLVLKRRSAYCDISAWACFLAEQTAVAPVDLDELREAFAEIQEQCRTFLEGIAACGECELAQKPVANWYPRDVPLPRSADVEKVEDLFTPRMLHGLAGLRAEIMKVAAKATRDLLLLAFSSTLARINRTFLSTTNRKQSRGGSSIFSLYRYKVAKEPVELPLWEQFSQRFLRLLEAKKETNRLIDGFYKERKTAIFKHGSATRLDRWLKPGAVDYIYTDPPYGGHIAYLDLATMWSAWLNIPISARDKASEIIEGGDLKKTRADYLSLLGASVRQMHEVLGSGKWLSVVFAHRDTELWDSLVQACLDAGFSYVNTVVQPVGVVWSVHKKKNPLRVLSGELVLNFRKGPPPVRAFPSHGKTTDPLNLVRQCCEREIVAKGGATTEDLHHAVVPALLESGLLSKFARECGDLTPVLEETFDFDDGKWHLSPKSSLPTSVDRKKLLVYFLTRMLRKSPHGTLAEVDLFRELKSTLGKISRGDFQSALQSAAQPIEEGMWGLRNARKVELYLF